jgi:integrase
MFVTWVRKDSLEDITRNDLLRYKQYIMTSPEKPRTVKPHTVIKLRSERTACNKVRELNQFLRWAMKQEPGKGLITMRDIKTVNKRFLQSGFRKQELAHLEWADVDFDHNILRVTAKERAGYKFEPKTFEERDVTVPRALMNRLRDYSKTSNKNTCWCFRGDQVCRTTRFGTCA